MTSRGVVHIPTNCRPTVHREPAAGCDGGTRPSMIGGMTTIRISDPVDLVKIVPYHLGYHPERSIVLIGLKRKHVGVIQRLDLPQLAADCAVAAELMVGHLRRDGCTGGIVVVYEDEVDHGRTAGAAVEQALLRHRVDLVESVVVRGERVYFPDRRGGAAQPIGGLLLPPDDQVPAIADYVAHGRRALPSRDALGERITPTEDPLRERVRVAAGRLGAMRPIRAARGRAMADWGAFLDVDDPAWFTGRGHSAARLARLGHSLRDLQLRDLISAWLCPGTLELEAFDSELAQLARDYLPAGRAWTTRPDQGLPTDGERDSTIPEWDEPPGGADRRLDEQDQRLVERLCELARLVPDGHAPAVLSLLASLCWHLGEGAMAQVALDRALALDPGYRLALLLERMLDLSIRPTSRLSSTG